MVRSFYVEITAAATPDDPGENFEAFVDLLMDRLQDEPGAHDADVGADAGSGRIDFCFHLDAEDSVAALRAAQVIARSAAHAAGAGTPGWEDVVRAVDQDEVLSSVRPSDSGLTPPRRALEASTTS